MQTVPSQCHKDVLELQRVGHFGPFNPNASRISVLRLMVESAGQSDGAAAVCHHFTGSCLHYHRSGVILCGWKEKEREGKPAFKGESRNLMCSLADLGVRDVDSACSLLDLCPYLLSVHALQNLTYAPLRASHQSDPSLIGLSKSLP